MVRKLVCWLMMLAYPASLMAVDSGVAMLHTNGTTWVNGIPAPGSVAVFPGDMVQTEGNAVASLSSAGSSIAILPGSLLRVETSKLGLDHGSVTVATSKKLAMHAGDMTVTPVADTWTEFQISESDGKVMIMARKGDVSVQDSSGTSTVAAGQQTTRSSGDAKKEDRRRGATPAAGVGGVLDSQYVIVAGGVAVGALITWVLLQDRKPFSPKIR